MNDKKVQIINAETGEVELERIFKSDFAIQYVSDIGGGIRQIGRIDSADFGEKHQIANWRYTEIARKLAERFDELSHVDPDGILFLENIHWAPPAGESRKRTWIARIKKADKFLENAWHYSYVVEIKGHFSSQMSKEQDIALVYHELRHIGEDGDIYPHDIEDWGNMVATLGANWATTTAEIANLLDDDFRGWKEIGRAGKQLSLFRGGVIEMAAMNAQE